MEKETIGHVLRRLHVLEKERRSWEGHWQEISELMLPSKGNFGTNFNSKNGNDGGKRNHKIVDSTALYALRILAAGMHGGLSSPARPWFRLSLKDREIESLQEVGLWLQDTQEKVHAVLAGSNFYPTVHAHYAELAAFGTGVFLIEDDEREVIRCRNLTVGEYYLDCDSRGRVDTLYRRFHFSAAQMMERFGDACPSRVKELVEAETDIRFEIIHAIEPRKKYNPSLADAKNRPFASYYVLAGQESVLLEEDGYAEFPACCPRWDVTGASVYGRGPGMDALPDVAMLQRMRADGLDALELEIKPPMNVSNSIRNQGGQFALRPGFANFVDTNGPSPAISPTYQVRANLQALDLYLQQIRKQIGEHFYKDLFLLLTQSDKRMTATEVHERNAEKLIMLGPTLERLRSELFQPLIQRVLGVMRRYGHLKPVPAALAGMEWEIEMQSTLALAQKSSDISAIKEISTYVGTLAAAKPEVLDNLDSDEMVHHSAKLMGVPPSIIRGKDLVAELRAKRNADAEKAMNEQKQMVLIENGIDMATKLSDVDLSKDSMATRMVDGLSSILEQAQIIAGDGGANPANPAMAAMSAMQGNPANPAGQAMSAMQENSGEQAEPTEQAEQIELEELLANPQIPEELKELITSQQMAENQELPINPEMEANPEEMPVNPEEILAQLNGAGQGKKPKPKPKQSKSKN